MLNMIINEICSLQGRSKSICYTMQIISTLILGVSCIIYLIPTLQTLETLDVAFYLSIAGILLFLEAIAIGTLLNLIDKRKRNSV